MDIITMFTLGIYTIHRKLFHQTIPVSKASMWMWIVWNPRHFKASYLTNFTQPRKVHHGRRCGGESATIKSWVDDFDCLILWTNIFFVLIGTSQEIWIIKYQFQVFFWLDVGASTKETEIVPESSIFLMHGMPLPYILKLHHRLPLVLIGAGTNRIL